MWSAFSRQSITEFKGVCDAPTRIDALLRLPSPKGFCTNGSRVGRLRSREHPGREKVVKFSSGCWSCLVCSVRLRLEYGRHSAGKLRDAEGVVFEKPSDPKEWTRDRQRLLRLRAEWVGVGCAGFPGVILGCHPAPFGTGFPDRASAVERPGRALRDLVPTRPVLGERAGEEPTGSVARTTTRCGGGIGEGLH